MRYKLLITTITLLNIISCSQKDESVNLVEKKEEKIVQKSKEKRPILQESISDDYLETIKRELEKGERTKNKTKKSNKITKSQLKVTPIESKKIAPTIKKREITSVSSDTPAHIRNSSIESVPRF